jgi:hypothetical protein
VLNCFSINDEPQYWFENLQVLGYDKDMYQLQERYEDPQRMYFIGYFMVDIHGRSIQLADMSPKACRAGCEHLSKLPIPL